MSVAFGLDRLLGRLAEQPELLAGRRWGLLAHAAALTRELEPAHLALTRAAGPPELLVAPEHGYHGVEQDMVAVTARRDPWTGAPILSLYDGEESLRPRPEAFAGLDLLLVDVQDVGSRYYTYVASAVWAARAALVAGLEVWILDRPNPLGGEWIEGNLVGEGFDSFVGAFRTPVCHGLTAAELVLLEAVREEWPGRDRLVVWPVEQPPGAVGRDVPWEAIGRPWIAPSPNMPTLQTARLYPGLCLVEGTSLSEGRGTTRPFQLVGAPGVDPLAVLDVLPELPGLAALPTYFRPQFQKHAGRSLGGLELLVTDHRALEPLRVGVEVIAAFARAAPEAFGWRSDPYEFVSDRPAIDLLAGGTACREALDTIRGGGSRAALDAWIATWETDQEAFRAESRAVHLYPRPAPAVAGHLVGGAP